MDRLSAFERVMVPVGELDVGDFVEVWDDYGEITDVTEHGRRIGDGTVDWRTFQIVFEGKSLSTTVGPLRCDRELGCWSR